MGFCLGFEDGRKGEDSYTLKRFSGFFFVVHPYISTLPPNMGNFIISPSWTIYFRNCEVIVLVIFLNVHATYQFDWYDYYLENWSFGHTIIVGGDISEIFLLAFVKTLGGFINLL